MSGKRWTEEEIAYLEERWGITPQDKIAEHLGRSIRAIAMMAHKLRMGPWLMGGDY